MLNNVEGDLYSPCNGFCNIDSKTNLCRGCFRKMSEIVEWQNYSDIQKMEVLERVKQRKEKYKHLFRE